MFESFVLDASLLSLGLRKEMALQMEMILVFLPSCPAGSHLVSCNSTILQLIHVLDSGLS